MFLICFLSKGKMKKVFYLLLENGFKHPYVTPYLAFSACRRATDKGVGLKSAHALLWMEGPSSNHKTLLKCC